jgi:hypothetical protein
MKPEDVQLVHRLWLDVTQKPGLDKLHHSDIITEALQRFSRDYNSKERERILREFRLQEDSRYTRSLPQGVGGSAGNGPAAKGNAPAVNETPELSPPPPTRNPES